MRNKPEHLHRTFGSSGNVSFSYRTTERDKAPAREVLTPILMGDPQPGREDRTPGLSKDRRRRPPIGEWRRYTESGPILLTFKEHAEYYGDDA